MRRRLAVALVTVALLATAVGPADAQTAVDVVVGNGGERVLYVEDLLGNDLTTLDFGEYRTLPFRVRVVDDAFDREDFTVLASMTNLYREDADGELEFDEAISSSEIEVVTGPNPLNVLDVAALVQPVLDLDVSLPNLLCPVLLMAAPCSVALDDVTGKLQTLEAVVDLTDLSNLPLEPQGAEAGAFTQPDYVGDAADDPAKPGVVNATQRRMLAGTVVDDAGLLAALEGDLTTLLGTLDIDDVVDESVLVDGLFEALTDLLGPLGSAVIDAVEDAVPAILAGTIDVVAEPLGADDVLYQTGSYVSYPALRVDVPETASNGTYRGTLVITGIQP